jgi:hypothetical protein
MSSMSIYPDQGLLPDSRLTILAFLMAAALIYELSNI